MSRSLLGFFLVASLVQTASAEMPRLEHVVVPGGVELPPDQLLTNHTIFLDRCEDGGCDVIPGVGDGTADPTPTMIASRAATLAPFVFDPGEWEEVVRCVQEVYSPFNLKVTDQRPTTGQYQRVIVAGTAQNPAGPALGLGPGIGGVGESPATCAGVLPKGVAFVFMELIDAFVVGTGPLARAYGTCWIIAQETAHNLQMDHQFNYVEDDRSACNDPMTYRTDCGGQKFFRNRFARCGEFIQDGPRACRCGTNQNSHLRLQQIFGTGTSIVPAPTATITTPAASSTAANTLPMNIIASAGSKRGVDSVELLLNGYKWAEVGGAPFGRDGQLNPSDYTIKVPLADLPDSIYDVEVRALDDLGLATTSTKVTVTKGPAGGCTSADACLKGQLCEGGKCFWAPPVGELGDECTFPQYCISGRCLGTAELQVCTQACALSAENTCPPESGTICIPDGGGGGICFPSGDEGGCCSTGGGGTSPVAVFGFGGMVFGLLVFGRRRARSARR